MEDIAIIKYLKITLVSIRCGLKRHAIALQVLWVELNIKNIILTIYKIATKILYTGSISTQTVFTENTKVEMLFIEKYFQWHKQGLCTPNALRGRSFLQYDALK